MATGPQGERDFTKEAEISVPFRAPLGHPAPDLGDDTYQHELLTLQIDNEHLRNLVGRLQSELGRTQKLLGKDAEALHQGDAGDEEGSVMPSWVFESETMTPLLVAYDHRIKDLESNNVQHGKTIDNLNARARALAAENDALRSELAKATAEGGAVGDRVALGVEGGDMQEVLEQMQVVQGEADLLRTEVETLTADVAQLRSAVGERDETLAGTSAQLAAAQQAVQDLQARLSTTMAEKAAAEDKLGAMSRALAEAQSEASTARTKAAGLASERDDLLRTLDDYKAALAELNDQAESESDALTARARAAGERSKELARRLAVAAGEAEAARGQLRVAERELADSRKDCENMLAVLNSLEKQVAEGREGAERVARLEEEAVAKVEAAVLDRDAAQAREAHARREIARLLEKRRTELAEAADSEEAAVAAVRSRLTKALEEREQEAAKHAARVSELTADLQRLGRDLSSSQAECGRLQRNLQAEMDRAAALVSAAQAGEREAADAAAAAKAEASRSNFALEAERAERARAIASLEAELATAHSSSEEAQAAATEARDALRKLKQEHADVTTAFEAFQRDTAANAAAASRESTAAANSAERDIKVWRGRVEELLTEVKRLERAVEDARADKERAMVRIQADAVTAVTHADERVTALRDERNSLSTRASNLNAQLAVANTELAAASAARNEAAAEAARLREAFDSLAADDADKAGRLAAIVVREQAHVTELAAVRQDVAGLTASLRAAEARAAAAEEGVADAARVHDALLAHLAASGVDIPPDALALSATLATLPGAAHPDRSSQEALATLGSTPSYGDSQHGQSAAVGAFGVTGGPASATHSHAAALEEEGRRVYEEALAAAGADASGVTTSHAKPVHATSSTDTPTTADIAADKQAAPGHRFGQAPSGRLADRDVGRGRFDSPVTELDSPFTGGAPTPAGGAGERGGSGDDASESYSGDEFEG